MDRESFLETIRKQYADEIHEAFVESSHQTGSVDWTKLNQRIGKLMKAAKAEGLPNKEFIDLVQSTLPEEARSQVSFSSEPAKKAA